MRWSLPLADHPALLAAVEINARICLDGLRRLAPAKAARSLILKLLGNREFNPEAPAIVNVRN